MNQYDNTAHDLQVKYQETYGLFNNRPIYITSITKCTSNISGYEILGYYCNPYTVNKEHFISSNTSDFNMIIPKLGFINHDNLAIFIERKHKKGSPTKYRKGLRDDNLTIINISKNEYIEAYNKPDPYNQYDLGETCVLQKIISSLFFPLHYSYEEALTLLLSFKKLSCAISPTIALAIDFRINKIVLYRNRFIIGIFKANTKSFTLKTDLFTDELIKIGVKIDEK